MKNLIFTLLLVAMLQPSISIATSSDDVNPDIALLLKMRLGLTDIGDVVKTPVEGVYQTRFGSKYAYLLDKGRYVFIGDMIDLKEAVNLTTLSRRSLAIDILKPVPADNLAIFPAQGETKAVLNVFTDTSCPYCKKLHEEVPMLQDAGIEVRYFPFPRGGQRGPGYKTLRQVWCAQDKANAMDIAKDVVSGSLPDADCEQADFVDKAHIIGNQVGVTGTPALFSDRGQKFDGYVPYKTLIPLLLKEEHS